MKKGRFGSALLLLVGLNGTACSNTDYVRTEPLTLNPSGGTGNDAGASLPPPSLVSCGDGYIDSDEECDDGNDLGGDGCTACLTVVCGNGRVDPGEACEPPGTQTCSASCAAIQGPACGDGALSPGEECEDGNARDLDGCSSACREERCGNQRIDPGELCEPPGASFCDSQCKLMTVVPAGCGNATREGSEECDDGNQTEGDGCSKLCLREACGNLRLDTSAGETCDPPEAGYCDPSCHVIARVCGDRIRAVTEQCDDGNTTGGDGCSAACLLEFCGDGAVNQLPGTEQCDPPNTPVCDSACRRIECGNRIVQGTEQCDDGNVLRGDGCDEHCLTESCGNGRIDPREDCETPGVGNCGRDCRAIRAECGDGLQQPGEECDDHNMAFGDGCSPTCLSERCGNGRVETPAEECEPPGTATCNQFCRLPRCGDRSVDPLEQCEDGNRTDGDGCSSDCRVEACGNGVVDVGEHCEPPTAGCASDCTWLPEQAPTGPLAAEQFRLTNTGFDTALSGWQLAGTPPASIGFSSSEAAPGAALLATGALETPLLLASLEVTVSQPVRAAMSQCIRTAPGVSYSAVARLARAEGSATPANVVLRARSFAALGCAGAASSVATNSVQLEAAPGAWSELTLGPLASAAGAHSLAISVELVAEQGQAPALVFVDNLEVSRTSAPSCGDGVPEGNEECEPSVTPGCTSQCIRPPRVPVCGDRIVTLPEECDPPGPACLANCTTLQTLCGDGRREGAEQCDPPNGVSCGPSCQTMTCGNNRVEPPEECDPPNAAGGCTPACRLVANARAVCGDGVRQGAEECDPPSALGWCSGHCQRRNPAEACGDGTVDSDLGEQCEPPGSLANNCGRTCKTAVCGDGKVEGAEQCDDAATGCSGCRFAFSGKQQECDACLSGSCRGTGSASSADLFSACFALQGTATSGAKAGTPLRQLCAEAAECMRQTSCAVEVLPNGAAQTPSAAACYCGKSVLDVNTRDDAMRACLYGSHPPDGACKQAFENAAQATTPGLVLAGMTPVGGQPALSAAVKLMSECGHDECKSACATTSTCGNSIVEPGEFCEPTPVGGSVNPFCAAGVCAILPCGNGVVDRTWPYGPGSELPTYAQPNGWKPETCDVADPFTNKNCDNCQLRVTCGDGKLTASVEACDPGPAGDWAECCKPDSTATDQVEGCDKNDNKKVDDAEGCQSPAKCGNSKREGVEECDPPADGKCSEKCKRTDACMECRRARPETAELLEMCLGATVVPSFREGCLEMLDCIERTRCDKIEYISGVAPSTFACLCGALNPATGFFQCIDDGGTGPCWDVAVKYSTSQCIATKAPDQTINACLVGSAGDPAFPTGVAITLASSYNEFGCAQECGYTL